MGLKIFNGFDMFNSNIRETYTHCVSQILLLLCLHSLQTQEPEEVY